MSASDTSVTLVALLKFEAPDGDVRLCDGGFVDHAAERYTSEDSVFGTVQGFEPVTTAFDDQAEGGTLVFAPPEDADVDDWWRDDLADSRVRLWLGELDSDGKTVTNATQLADWLADTAERTQGVGQDLLSLDLIARTERLFQVNEGNVLSERHHTSVFSGELGLRHCTDLRGFVAWGAESPPRSAGASGGAAGGGGAGGNPGTGGRNIHEY